MSPSHSSFVSEPVLAPVRSRWRRWAIRAAVALALLAVIAWGLFTYFCFNPFEGKVPGMLGIVPASSTVALHGSAGEILATPFVRNRILGNRDLLRMLAGPEGDSDPERDLDRAEEQLRRAEEDLNAQLPGFLKGVSASADLFGGDTVLFGDPVLDEAGLVDPMASRMAVATRVSGRARALLGVLKHDWARRRIEKEAGVIITRSPLLYTIDLSALPASPGTPSAVYLSLVRDALIAGNDQDLVQGAARLAEGAQGGALTDRADAGELFGAEGAPLQGFVDLAAFTERHRDGDGLTPGEMWRSEDGLTGFLGFLLDPDLLATAGARIEFPGDEECVVSVRGIRGDRTYSEAAGALSGAVARGGADALAESAAMAPSGSAVLAARLEMPAGNLVRLLYGRGSAEVRKAVDEGLIEAKSSIDTIARDADDLVVPGVSVVVERLPECDDLALDTYGAGADGKFVLPLPGVLLILRLRPDVSTTDADRFLRQVQQWVPLRRFEDLEDLPGSMTGFRAEPKFLTQEKELVRPVVALEGDLVLLASNEGTLRRALKARDGEIANFHDMERFWAGAGSAGPGQAHVIVDFEAMLTMARDNRREVATERVAIDWKEERRRIHSETVMEMMKDRQVIVQKEVVAEVDRRVEMRRQVQRDVEFPDAVREYVAELRRWHIMRSFAGSLTWDEVGMRLGLVLRTEE